MRPPFAPQLSSGGMLRAAVIEWLEDRRLMSSIAGAVYNDLDGDGSRDAGETGLQGWTVYLDQNRNRTRDALEAFTLTQTDGSYGFANLSAGTYYVAQEVPPLWEQTTPGGGGPGGTASGFKALTAADWFIAPPQPTTSDSVAPMTLAGLETGPIVLPADAQSESLIRLNSFRADTRFAGIDGSGYSIAVLDTGIDLNHPFFGADVDNNGIADRIVYHYDFANNDADASDRNGHGSNVAGIAAGANAQSGGMAPGANIIALKVFTDAGGGTFGYIEQALQWVVNNAAVYNIVSVNMSLSDTQNYSFPLSLYGIGDEMAALASMGVVVCSAAGNDFYARGSAPGVAYPAADPNSLAVSAVWDADAGAVTWSSGAKDFATAPDRVTSFSQRSPTLTDVFAPGAFITGPNATGGTVAYAGTSQASPHIAGIAALAQELADRYLGRRLGVSEFRDLLRSTAVTIVDGDDEQDNVTNTGASYPRVDVAALAEAIYAMGATLPFGHAVTIAGSFETYLGLDFGARALPVVPDAPLLAATSDTGASASDGLTASDNATPARRLEFTVGGTTPGNTVRVYADGALIGTATATGGTTSVFSDGALALVDGIHTVTARQATPNGPESAASAALSITVDTISPIASAGAIAPVLGSASTQFAVTCTDLNGIDVTTLDGSDVRVTGPNGFDQPAALVQVSAANNGSPRTATYAIAAPGGAWDVGDAGTYTISLQPAQVRDTAGNDAAAGTLTTFTISGPPPQSPYRGAPFAFGAGLPVIIQAEDFDLGGEGFAFHDTTLSNIGNVYRNEAVDVKLIANTTNQFRLSDAAVGEWVEYSIVANDAATYELELRLSNADPNARVHVEIDGVNVTSAINVPDTNNFSVFSSVKRQFAVASGAHVLRLAFDVAAVTGSVAGVDWMRLAPVPPPGTATTLTAAAATYVRNGSYASQNFGTSNDLIVKRSATTGNTREIYLKFDLSSLSVLNTAKLRLSGRLSATTNSNVLTRIYSATNTTWSETGLTWNNKPTSGTSVRGSLTVNGTTATWYEVDLTSFLKSEFAAGRKVVTLVLKNPNTTDAQTIFASDETTNGPQLVVA